MTIIGHLVSQWNAPNASQAVRMVTVGILRLDKRSSVRATTGTSPLV